MTRWYSDTTQIAWACAMLATGEEISHACEYESVKGWRLSAIINILRHDYGWPIITEFRGSNRIGFYKLKPGTDVSKLKHPKSYRDYLIKQALLEIEEEDTALSPSKESDTYNPNPEDIDN